MTTLIIDIDSERVKTLLKRLSVACSPEGFNDTLEEIGEDLIFSTRQRFIQGVAPDGSRWPGLAQATVLRRLGGKDGMFQVKNKKISAKGIKAVMGMRPLIDTGTLSGSVTKQVLPGCLLVGVNRTFDGNATAAVHQFGTDRAGRRRNVTIPARPFLGLSDEDVQGIEITVIRAIEKETQNDQQ